jgi:hypothetical protein
MWYGSELECLAFAREVAQSDQFTGKTPLLLYRKHERLAAIYKTSRPNYWLEPQVWPDVKASFDRCLHFVGDVEKVREQYVTAAVRCQQWKTATEQIGKLKDIDYNYFGGKARFEEIKRDAEENARQNYAHNDGPVSNRSRANFGLGGFWVPVAMVCGLVIAAGTVFAAWVLTRWLIRRKF